MALSDSEKEWYIKQIKNFDEKGEYITLDEKAGLINYSKNLRSDESLSKSQEPEEVVHALAIAMLCSEKYKYNVQNLYHEQYFAHGSSGSLSDEVDLMIYDEDGLPYALWEFKAASEYKSKEDKTIEFQLFGTAPLTKGPKLLVYATIEPRGKESKITLKCIDYTKYKSYESWVDDGKPFSTEFPVDYRDIDYKPLTYGGERDLKLDCNQADFRAVASSFHNEFFGEHPDNSLFINLVKCLLAKIYDERTIRRGDIYKFQVLYKNNKPESAKDVFEQVNELYKSAYLRYIEPNASVADEIDPKEFSKEKVKLVVMTLEAMSLTRGAALHGDIIGAFFEEILRVGFKQDKGMYFTHSNIVKFMIEAIGLEDLTKQIWKNATHPENRLPYIIDPSCGSGTFLLHSMNVITKAIKQNESELVDDFESRQFYNARMSDATPNYWAENFIYGFDPKFVMAITAKVNMVLHGDGAAHILKEDAFSTLNNYSDTKLRPAGVRSVNTANYDKDICETFDVILSNPPFGVTLAAETKRGLSKAFSLPTTLPSEALFLERCYQLLKPNGRLGLVLPESIFNAVDLMPVRMFLYRMFKIKSIVALPRNVFIDTPTLTSLVFAQKKTGEEIKEWDEEWKKHIEFAQNKIKRAKTYIQKNNIKDFGTPKELLDEILEELRQIISDNEWIIKKGKNAEIIPIKYQAKKLTKEGIRDYYKILLSSNGVEKFILRYAFEQTASKFNYEYPSFIVEEVGYKLSKRKEKNKPNQLCVFKGLKSGKVIGNLHLCSEDYEIIVDRDNPNTVLDFIAKEVEWE
ncbi:class I SAM-dependent DNA methyltransferase [Lysinibacillus fusiformis]|uniref:HsdM family class I SAM-dependent methyltransferase n=1 Tax=Lysinibacillus fusiformis TaxID=28031 RepID=UPI001C92CA02|nr:N-6 DNA methylase [Lysinibacillus fusiformis]